MVSCQIFMLHSYYIIKLISLLSSEITVTVKYFRNYHLLLWFDSQFWHILNKGRRMPNIMHFNLDISN